MSSEMQEPTTNITPQSPALLIDGNDVQQKIAQLEQNALVANEKLENLEKELKRRNIENNILRQKLTTLEQEINDNAEAGNTNGANGSGGGKNSKKQQKNKNDDTLTKAKELLFEKTKVNKQQEQQIQAFKLQIASLKDVVNITKDMVELRNAEVKHLQTRFDTIELRMKAETEVKSLTEKKLLISKKLYTDLKEQYDMQTQLFKQLQHNYCEKITLMEAEMEFARSVELKKQHQQLQSKLLVSQAEMKNNQPSTSGASKVVNGTTPAVVVPSETTSAESSVSVAVPTSPDGEINLTLNPAAE